MTGTTAAALWKVYGHTYDGLLHFGPYVRLVDEINRRCAIAPTTRILELGCGTGNVLERLTRGEFGTATGIDSSPSMLAIARRKLAGRPVTLIQAEVLGYLSGLESGSVDRIVLNNVAYAIDDQDQLWSDVLRVLAPGGFAVVSNPDTTGSWSIIRDHLAHDSPARLLHPKLLGVFVVDQAINVLGRRGDFHFTPMEALAKIITESGGQVADIGTDYGDTNVTFQVCVARG